MASAKHATKQPRGAELKGLSFFRVHSLVPQIRPGRPDRAWMDATPDRFAYRCLPLTIANSLGWEVLLPCRVEAEWNGGQEIDDLRVDIADAPWCERKIASSHFGSGILTFQFGYVTRTDAGTGLLVRGVPNRPKDGIAPLEGFVETDWLPFTFTMNWQFTRPGKVTFDKDEPFCFLTPLSHHDLLEYRPTIAAMAEDPVLEAEYKSWSSERREFNQKLLDEDPATVRQAWQRWYTLGRTADGQERSRLHLTKLSLAAP
ncbi:MAG: DUF6065 family protein, partial [Sphingomonadales bacterium]